MYYLQTAGGMLAYYLAVLSISLGAVEDVSHLPTEKALQSYIATSLFYFLNPLKQSNETVCLSIH